MAIETFEGLPIVDIGGRSLISALDSKKIGFPNDGADFGNSGDQLRSLGNGAVEWAAPGMPTYEQTEQAISDWLNAHPEATTTVADGAITDAKLNDALKRGLVYGFETVTDTNTGMKYADNLVAGMICHTNGFHTSGDGGAAWYEISATGTANEMDVIACGDLYANLVIADESVTPEMFGAYGDETHDDTDAIQRAIDSCDNVVLNKDYLVALKGSDSSYWPVIDLPSNSNLEINGTITLEANDSQGYHIINIERKTNVTIKGVGKIIGDKDVHIGSLGEYGHCICIGSSSNVTIDGLTVTKGWGDGICISDLVNTVAYDIPENITINNCKFIDNSRNQLSIVACKNSFFTNLYMNGIYRTAPKSGIDIEPNTTYPSEYVDNLVFSNCQIFNCGEYSILIPINTANNYDMNISFDNVVTNEVLAINNKNQNVNISIKNLVKVYDSNSRNFIPFTINNVENSNVLIEGKLETVEALKTSERPIVLWGKDAYNVSMTLRLYGVMLPKLAHVSSSDLADYVNKNTYLELIANVPQNFAELSTESIVLWSKVNVVFPEIEEINVDKIMPSYGANISVKHTGATIRFYKTRAQIGAKYFIRNDSGGNITLSPSVGVTEALAADKIVILECFKQGKLSKIITEDISW